MLAATNNNKAPCLSNMCGIAVAASKTHANRLLFYASTQQLLSFQPTTHLQSLSVQVSWRRIIILFFRGVEKRSRGVVMLPEPELLMPWRWWPCALPAGMPS